MRESVAQRRQTVVIEEESRDNSATPTELVVMGNNCVGNNSLGGESPPAVLANDRDCETHTTDISTTTTTTITSTTNNTIATTTPTTITNNADNTNGKDIVCDSSRIDSNINVILIYNTRLWRISRLICLVLLIF